MAQSTEGSDSELERLKQELLDAFRPTVEESLILLIAQDYDLTRDFETARGVLVSLAENVAAEEQSSLDQNGISYDDPSSDQLERPQSGGSVTVTTESSRRHNDDSSRTDLSETFGDQCERLDLSRDVDVSKLDHDGKVAELAVVFPDLKRVDIGFIVKKAGDDYGKAFDELLNTQYLEENGLHPRGINGAFRPDHEVSYKKARNKARDKSKAGKTKVDLGYNLKPSGSPIEGVSTATSTASSSTATSPALRAVDSSRPNGARASYIDLAQISSVARESSRHSFAAASSANRRGKSDPLFRPVAAIYAERGRDQMANARLLDSDAYDALVNEQSSDVHIDLHGVTVADGVRIALQRTKLWWDNLGEYRAQRAREGFTVVTGLGTHSASGVSRLRQEVGAALKREGWRVRTETGKFVVTGRQ